MGDIAGLAASIQKVGLLHPVVVDEANRLIVGARRIGAAKALGWTRIEARVAKNLDDALLALKAEADENVQRKQLSILEALSVKEALLPLERAAAKKRQEEHGKTAPGRKTNTGGKKPQVLQKSRDAVAAVVGYSATSLRKAEEVAAAAKTDAALVPVVEKMGKTGNVHAAVKALHEHQLKQAMKRAAASVKKEPADLRVASMEELLASIKPGTLDAIITDPPYGREHLPLYGKLAELARKALKPDGVLAVMVGQSYLPEILALMAAEIEYLWIVAYLTPGPSARLWHRKVFTAWKPVLVFGKRPCWSSDLVSSDVSDKRFHAWGQSESGMRRLVEALTQPGAKVCDPFLGGGTTGVACIAAGRLFVGCDVNPGAVANARLRMKALHAEKKKSAAAGVA